MDFDLVALGSLFLDGRVTSANENYVAGSTINISDAPPDLGGRILWLRPKGMDVFIASDVLLKGITWDDLDTQSFTMNKVVTIGKTRYICRLPKYKHGDIRCEWHQILKAVRDCPHFHSNQAYCYVDEQDYKQSEGNKKTIVKTDGYRTIRWFTKKDNPSQNVGFRPILEPLSTHIGPKPTPIFSLEGDLFALELPLGRKNVTDTNSYWDKALSITHQSQDKSQQFHCDVVASLCQELSSASMMQNVALAATTRGGETAGNFARTGIQLRKRNIGFRPVLAPLINRDGIISPNLSVFPSELNGKGVKLYSMLVNEKPILSGTLYQFRDGDKISLSDEFYGMEYLIPWIIIQNKAMAQNNLVVNISWMDLANQGFVAQRGTY